MDIQKVLVNEQISNNLNEYDIFLNDSNKKFTLEQIDTLTKHFPIKYVYELNINEITKKIKIKQYPLVESA